MNKEKNFDIIVIGSGIGGLTTASIMSQIYHKKVLVLEKHFKPGGFTHTFKRKNYHWDVGVHYIGEMAKGNMPRKVFDFITDKKLEWNKMPDLFEKFVYPDFTFNLYSGKSNFKKALIEQFPDEKGNIEIYFDDLKKAQNFYGLHSALQTFPYQIRKKLLPLILSFSSLASKTTADYMNNRFTDEKLKAVLVSQWGDQGLPPGKSSFLIHAVIATHYFEGGYYPVGSSASIAQEIIPTITKNGGEVLTGCEVEEIIVENDRAAGVKIARSIKNKSEIIYYADTIISNAGAYNTYTKFLKNQKSLDFIEDIKNFRGGTAHLNLFLGLKESPEKLGFKGENHWIYTSYDHDRTFNEANNIFDGEVSFCYLSLPSLKDPQAKGHTAEIITMIDYEKFSEWKEKKWKNRGGDYEELKREISGYLIDFVEARYPGFKELIDYHELSTPLSTELFTSHHKGSIYGIPATPERYKVPWIGITTPIKNLFLSGSDTVGHGVVGAMMGGVITAATISGIPFSLFKIFGEIGKS